LTMVVEAEEPRAGAVVDTILDQDPKSGRIVARGTVVKVTVSVAPASVAIPDLVGLTVERAATIVEAAGLVLEVASEEESEDRSPGVILNQEPVEGSVVDRGGRVRVRVSKGPPPSARLRLVRVGVTYVEEDDLAEITVLLRNDGDQVGIVTAVEIRITGYQFIIASGQIRSSATYDVELPITAPLPDMFAGGEPRVIEASVEQFVDPVGPTALDQFVIRLAPEPGGPAGIHDYVFDIAVIYDEGTRTNMSESLTARLGAR
jgi:hypothetical protein